MKRSFAPLFALIAALPPLSAAPPPAPASAPAPAGAPAPQPAAAPLRLLVLPLDVRNEDERYAPFSEGLGPDLAERLEYAGVPVIPDYALNRQLETAAIDTPEALSFASQRRLAQLAGAHALLTGAVAGDADAARVSLRLVLAGEPAVLARIEEKVAWGQLPEFLARAARTLGAALQVQVADTDAGVTAGALELYFRARGELTPELRISYLKTSLEMAPGFLRARLRLADLLLAAQKTDSAAEVIAPLGEGSGGAPGRVALLKAKQEFLSGRTGAAEQWAQASLAAAPSPGAQLLLGKIRLSIGDYAAALRYANAALALDPADPASLKLRDKAAASLAKLAPPSSTPMLSPAPPPAMTVAPAPK
jgi:tetratricopeptide (TPR) repeat protein